MVRTSSSRRHGETLVKSKAEVIRAELIGLRVLDIGGSGFGEDNAYERQLRDAWSIPAYVGTGLMIHARRA